MTIESGIAGGIGRAAPVAGASLESMFGPKIGSIMPEGGSLMGAKNLGTIDLNGGTKMPGLSPVGGEILFQVPSVPNVIQQAETVAATVWGKSELSTPVQPILSAESIQAIAEVVEPRMIKEATYWFTDVPGPRVIKPAEVIMPKVEPMIVPIQTRTENRVSARPAVAPATAILPKPAPVEQEVEEIVEEKVKKQKPEERLEETEEIESQMYLEDENASSQRRIEVREAVVKARVEADRLGLKNIAGWLVAKFLPGENEGNRSQVVRKTGPDGSYQETVEAITGAGEFETGEKAVERFDGIVAEKKPVKFGKSGNPVDNIDIARVFKYKLIKPIQVYEEVTKRVIKKKVLVSQTENPVPTAEIPKNEIKAEPNLEELSPALADVFKKAA